MNIEEIKQKALELHEKNQGKLEVVSKVKVNDAMDLALAYTPGVAEPCKKIHEDNSLAYKYTNKGNMVAVVTDGSAVLGLGNIGGIAGMPVMEGKSVLFKEFGNVDAFPICLNTQDTEEIISTVKAISPSFGGINLEDIAAPRCFEIEKRLIEELDIPVFHDDQHGTAVIVLSAVINALRIVKKDISDVKIVISGAGAAGIAISNLLTLAGAKNNLILNSRGIIDPDDEKLDEARREIARTTNPNKVKGDLKTAMENADIFIGVSAPGILTKEMVASMNNDAIVLAMANPVPEIYPDEAKEAGARVVGTGRSDYPNQVNNVLVFPGIFRGALDAKADRITDDMKLSAAYAIAHMVEQPVEERILPEAFNKDVAKNVANAVKKSWEEKKVIK
ncbi:NADP-dependent malic enzyme [Finegoldia magna]|uniref:NAD-dependent malic enzyme n=2 Tax=Finegoldia magna TaxID=1260 RepID=A0A133N5E1_FINMA|nr:NADP-dependent malic enzyme [Finegoldia magna]EFK93320.1 malic enzyme, NAD binding domain protein [Finegoldia magna ACS-171-V-Col3]EFL53809.1 malic enzyme, NAD binding domain protein [Finegoldia magna BVS033A4]KXA11516.1 putative NAD-dependent malic enzyme [Finegoldia magna]MDU4732103.1 NADP-dependent malic enzyme [Finegoldia magna]MDU5442625.1 NADP-dependent malic enzyme [Finegoldia magna]